MGVGGLLGGGLKSTCPADTTAPGGSAGAGHETVRDDSGDHGAVAHCTGGVDGRREARRFVAGARADAMAVSGLPRGARRIRSCRGADVAPSRHLPVSDASARRDPTGPVPHAWRETSARAVGGAAESVHAADGTAGHRSDPAVQHRQGRVRDRRHQLGRSVGHHAARRGARSSAQDGAPDSLHRRG